MSGPMLPILGNKAHLDTIEEAQKAPPHRNRSGSFTHRVPTAESDKEDAINMSKSSGKGGKPPLSQKDKLKNSMEKRRNSAAIITERNENSSEGSLISNHNQLKQYLMKLPLDSKN